MDTETASTTQADEAKRVGRPPMNPEDRLSRKFLVAGRPAQVKSWQDTAKVYGITTSEWIRRTLDAAVGAE